MKVVREELIKKMLEATGEEQEEWAILLDYNTSRKFRKTMEERESKDN